MVANLAARVTRLEVRPVSDATIRATVERLAREHDLDVGELYDETVRILAMTPAERAHLAAELGMEAP